MEKYIKVMINEAYKAFKKKEIPVGCVIVKDGKILAKAHNKKQRSHRCIDHAEILAVINVEKKIKDWRLNGCDLYVTLEPCKMCMEVIRQARIKNVYYLLRSNFNNEDAKNIEKHEIENCYDVKEKYKEQLSAFFVSKR